MYFKLICDDNKYSSRRFIKSQFGEPVFENGGKYFIKFKDGHVNYCKIFVKEYYDKWYDEFANDVKEKIDGYAEVAEELKTKKTDINT